MRAERAARPVGATESGWKAQFDATRERRAEIEALALSRDATAENLLTVAKSHKSTVEELSAAYHDPAVTLPVKVAVAGHRLAGEPVRTVHALDADGETQWVWARSARTPDLLAALSKSPAVDVREMVAALEWVDEKTLRRLKRSTVESVATAAHHQLWTRKEMQEKAEVADHTTLTRESRQDTPVGRAAVAELAARRDAKAGSADKNGGKETP